DQESNIVTAFAEAREVNGNNIEPIVEILPESAVLDSFFERFVARRDNADVYVNRDVVAHSADFAFLENAQESALQHRGHGPDFIQKNRATIGLLKKAFLVIDGAGEGSFAMAEQLGFQKILRQRAAIYGNKRRKLAPTVEMERLGDQLLARAAFAENKNRAVGVRQALNHFEHLVHSGRTPDDLAELVFLFELLAEINVFGDGRIVGKSPLNAQFEFVQFERFLQIVIGALFHGLHGRF